jgi:peptidylprolyl isomerase
MPRPNRLLLALLAALPFAALAEAPVRPMPEVLAASTEADWRSPDPDNLLLMQLPQGLVLMELAPDFAPAHVANIRQLVRQGYFDGLVVLRSQDNYVVQWGDPDASDADKARSLGEAKAKLAPEFDRALDAELPFFRLPDGDVYAPEIGFSASLPAARDPAAGRMWLAHCYGMLGVGRDNAADSGNGASLFVVTGHAPRHLDRNISLVGRVLQGMEHLSALPRGSGALGFYQGEERGPTIRSLRLASQLPQAERPRIEVFRSDGPAFAALVASRRHRHEAWFHAPTGRIELCNVPLPVRERSE